jgi:hypothetical protein
MELNLDRHSADLLSLYRDLLRPNVVFILGAGASAPYVPLATSLLTRVNHRYNGLWGFPYDKRDRRTLRFIVNGTHGKWWPEWLDYAPWESVSLLIQRELTVSTDRIPPQYDLLRRLLPTILTLNVDGLASHYLSRSNQVFELHGRVNPALTRHPDFDEILELTTDGFELPEQPPLHLYGKESSTLVESDVYRSAYRSLRQASAVVIVGYSFGKSTWGLDDDQTLEWLVYQMRNNNCPFYILDPNPKEVASLVGPRVRGSVTELPIAWNLLCEVLLDIDRPPRNRQDFAELAYEYNWLLNSRP